VVQALLTASELHDVVPAQHRSRAELRLLRRRIMARRQLRAEGAPAVPEDPALAAAAAAQDRFEDRFAAFLDVLEPDDMGDLDPFEDVLDIQVEDNVVHVQQPDLPPPIPADPPVDNGVLPVAEAVDRTDATLPETAVVVEGAQGQPTDEVRTRRRSEFVRAKDDRGNTALHLLFSAAWKKERPVQDFSQVITLLAMSLGDGRRGDVALPDDLALTRAVSRNLVSLAVIPNDNGDLPLHQACSVLDECQIPVECLQSLIDAFPLGCIRANGRGQTPLHLHAHCRPQASVDVARRLWTAAAALPPARVDDDLIIELDRVPPADDAYQRLGRGAYNNNGGLPAESWTPLHAAAWHLNTELVLFLIASHPGLVTIPSSPTRSLPLHFVCQRYPTEQHLPLVQALLDAGGRNMVLNRDSNDAVCLHYLCRNIRRIRGRITTHTPPESSAATGISVSIALAIINTEPEVCQHRDLSDGYLPLHRLCEATDLSVIDRQHPFQLEQMRHHDEALVAVATRMLEAHPRSTRVLTRKNDTPLSLACASNQSKALVTLLLTADAALVSDAAKDVKTSPAYSIINNYGYNPLHSACRAYHCRPGIVQALLEASPGLVLERTNAGETAFHLASSNPCITAKVLEELAEAAQKLGAPEAATAPPRKPASLAQDAIMPSHPTTPKQTPLHQGCNDRSSAAQIESLACAHPEWITLRDQGGLTPLQVLCKNGHVDENLVRLFCRIGGASVFSVTDAHGNTPLHSAMRAETSFGVIMALIRACPEALHVTTTDGNTPLHLACFRKVSVDLIREVAIASCRGLDAGLLDQRDGARADQNEYYYRISPLMAENKFGQTPISIAMDDFRSLCRNCTSGSCSVQKSYNSTTQERAFDVLSTFVDIIFYGPEEQFQENEYYPRRQRRSHRSLVRACLSLHRQDIRLDPVFIRRALYQVRNWLP
jgi:ankyrin repeat protein